MSLSPSLWRIALISLLVMPWSVAAHRDDTHMELGTDEPGSETDDGHSDEPAVLDQLVVTGRQQVLVGEARTASEGLVGAIDLDVRPLLRPGDLLEAVPGLIVTQHSGSGKSNQLFLRGFNLDHGTDFATWVDGMPVNLRTHGHGQGYTDINFLIPETVSELSYVKGPYHAELGDFSSAGGVHISTADRPLPDTLKLGAGEYGFSRALVTGGRTYERHYLTAALEAQQHDGPWTDIEEDVDKINGYVRMGGNKSDYSWTATAMHYQNEWNSADQIPERAVRQGLIDEFGSIDPSLGGESRRSSVSARFSHEHEAHRSETDVYLISSKLNLWSNFNYLLDDPVDGDQFEQVDDRTVAGGRYTRYWVNGDRQHFHHSLGVELRYDNIDEVGLYRTQARQRQGVVRQDQVKQGSVGLYYELAWYLAERWRAVIGLRGDYYRFDVDALRSANSGRDRDSIISPKVSLIYALSDQSELYLSAGSGFHSNDARGTVISQDPVSGDPLSPVDPLVASDGAELGFKALWADRWNTSMAAWYLELDSELLFVGDAGNTEASRPSRRWGIEWNNAVSLNNVWSLEADLAWTDAQFSDVAPEGDQIPGALDTVVSGAVTAQDPSGWFGSLRLRHFGAAPLIEDGSVTSDGSTIANLALGWEGRHWRVQMDILNLFDSRDHDIDYFYTSRLPGEPLAGVDDIHYHVFEPRQARLYASFMF